MWMRDDQFYTGPSGVGQLRSLSRAVPVLVPVLDEGESPWSYYLVMGCERPFPLRTVFDWVTLHEHSGA